MIFAAAALLATAAARPTVAPYDVTFELNFGERTEPGGFIVLTDPFSHGTQPFAPRTLHVAIAPPPTEVPGLAVTATGGIQVALESSFGFGLAPQIPDVKIDRAGYLGPFTISATVGAPVNVRAAVAGYAYERLAIGCALGNAGGARYTATGALAASALPAQADIYITGPVNAVLAPWDHCTDNFHDAGAAGATLHVPGGAIDLADATDFQSVTARAWTGSLATVLAVADIRGTLLWRTRGGRLVKTLVQIGEDGVLEGATIAADVHDTFADVAASRGPVLTRVKLAPGDVGAAGYRAAFTENDPILTPYGKVTELEVVPPYVAPACVVPAGLFWGDGAAAQCPPSAPFANWSTSLGLSVEPLPNPTPIVTWSTQDEPMPGAERAVEMGFAPLEPHGLTLFGVHPGRATIIASIGPPVSRRLTIPATAYDVLVLFPRGSPHALKFSGSRAVSVENEDGSDLFMSRDGTLHFPGGGVLLTNGNDTRREAPPQARVGPAFTALGSDSWRDDRDSIDAAAWETANAPCGAGRAGGSVAADASCKKMSASVALFKCKFGFVKLHVLNFSGGALRASFQVLGGSGETTAAIPTPRDGPVAIYLGIPIKP